MRIRWLGRVPYREAWAVQRAVSRRTDDDYLLLLEHPHVYTLGTNGDAGHVLVDPASVGAEVIRVDRGGDVTYHGPGQLVGYPVVTVGPGPHRGPEHVRRVEQVVIDALVALGLPAGSVGRLPGYPGVWAGLDGDTGSGSPWPRKICAIGVRTSRGRTTHGFALNVRTDLSMFDHIVPCGLAGMPVTSLAAEGCDVTMSAAVDAIAASARSAWGPVDDVQRVTDPARADQATATSGGGGVEPVAVAFGHRRPGERSLDRRLRQSGADPGAGLPLGGRKPPWLRVKTHMGVDYLALRNDLRDLDLVTVCEEAGCPNIYECWSDGTATFMINGSRCTRACGFCQVDTRHPLPVDAGEPERVAEAVQRMGLAHAVVTCVARDDLADGGAEGFARVIAAVRHRAPRTTIEVLISDCKGRQESLDVIFTARPDVLNHNIETVARLQRAVRPSAGYARSLSVLARAKDAGLTTKSGIILGMGEREDEVLATLADLRAVGVDIVTAGQYLRPSSRHLPVARWWTPDEFDALREAGMAMGFSHVQASPLTRSSYHARQAAAASVPVHAGSAAGAGPDGRPSLGPPARTPATSPITPPITSPITP
ncbi:MAG TPA: lipoyl synthase [Acidimicrobiales bacterium]